MDDEEFEAFPRIVVVPMIQRHREMFPRMHQRFSTAPMQSEPSFPSQPEIKSLAEIYRDTDPYAPCPCQSGRKYKFCCAKQHR